jgi:cytochrome c oxidase subunit IV
MEKKSLTDKDSADHQDRKLRLIFITVGLLTVVSAIAVTVVWFTLIGHAIVALLDFIAAGSAGAKGGH